MEEAARGGLRDQALELISDAQTADKKDKEVLLRQVQELCLHRDQSLLDEIVPIIISEFQADPNPPIRKFLAEYLEEVVKAQPSFCQPGMVDVYSHALLHDSSALVIKRVLVACTNVHRSVFRYAAMSGLTHLWADYCTRIKDVVLNLGEGPRVSDPGVAQGVMKFMEGLIFCGSVPSRSSAIAPRPNDTFSVADLGPDQQALFNVEGLKQEAEMLLGRLITWVTHGKQGFTQPQYQFLINTLSAIGTHRLQFFPTVCAAFAALLTLKYLAHQLPQHNMKHLEMPGVVGNLKSSCLKLARLSAAKSFPQALEALVVALWNAGMSQEISTISLPEPIKRTLAKLNEHQQQQQQQAQAEAAGAATAPGEEKRKREEAPADEPPDFKRQRVQDVPPVQPQALTPPSPPALPVLPTPIAPLSAQQPPPPDLLYMPPHWYSLNGPERAVFLIRSLSAVPLPPPEQFTRTRGAVVRDADEMVERLVKDLTGEALRVDIAFIREVAMRERPMDVDGTVGIGQGEAVTEIQMGSRDELSPEKLNESLKIHAAFAVDRILHAEGKVESFGAGSTRMCIIARLACLIGALGDTGFTGPLGRIVGYASERLDPHRREMIEAALYELYLSVLLERQDEGEADDEEEEQPDGDTPVPEDEPPLDEERLEVYDTMVTWLLRRLLSKLDPKDRQLTSLVLSMPRMPLKAVDLLDECVHDKTGQRLMQGLMTLTDLCAYRGPECHTRTHALTRVLQATVDANHDLRRRAIQNAIVKRLHPVEDLQEEVEGFARAVVDTLLEDAKSPDADLTRKPWWPIVVSLKESRVATAEDVKRRLYLYLALCSKNENLIAGVLELYSRAGEQGLKVVQTAIAAEMDVFVQHVLKVHGYGQSLQSLVGVPPGATPLLLHILHLIVPDTLPRPRPPQPDVVAAAKALRQTRGGDMMYVLPVLGGLTKAEMEEDVLPRMMATDQLTDKWLKRIIIPYGPLTAAEALASLHSVDPEAHKLPLKKYLEQLQHCLNMKTLFPQTAISLALVKMVEDKAVPVPYAFMRTVILAIKMYPALKAIVASTVVPKLVEREVWKHQPRVWEGVILLPKYIGARDITEPMSEALLALPALQLGDMVKKCGEVRPVLASYVTRSKKSLDAAKRKALGM